MVTAVIDFFSAGGMSPHAVCLLWRTDLLVLHAFSDLAIALAYFVIPYLVIQFLHRRPDLIDRRIAILFAIFIFSCGVTHLAGLLTLWYPYYGWQALIKLVTAGLSVTAAFILWRRWPQLMAMRGGDSMARAQAQIIAQTQILEATEQSNARLQEFASMAAHDLRSPLSSLGAIPELMRGELKNPDLNRDKLNKHIDLISAQTERMSTLISDLLSYSKVGLQHHEREHLDTDKTIAEVVDYLQIPQGFTVSVSESLPDIQANRAEFELIVRNLIGNAVSHHDRSQGNITVAGEISDDGLWYVLDVIDDGPGVADEFKEAIFERFFRIGGAAAKSGSGLGLSAVARAVDAAGGNIEVLDTNPERGATFRVYLPQHIETDQSVEVDYAERPRLLSEDLASHFEQTSPSAKRLCVLIGQLFTLMRARNGRLIKEAGFNLNRDEIITLTGLRLSAEPHALKAQALSERLHVTTDGIASVCSQLDRRGYIETETGPEGDDILYRLTAKGVEAANRVIPIVHETELEVTRSLRKSEIRNTCRALERMTHAV